jgi:hypothetical protein
MEGIDIDSIVRKAVTEYRKQERDLAEAKAAHTFTVAVDGLIRRIETLERIVHQFRP